MLKLRNFVGTTLIGPIAAGATSATINTNDGVLFDDIGGGNYCYATLIPSAGGAREIIKVTGRSGDMLTIVKAQDGTSDLTWSAGALLERRFNKATLEELLAERDPRGKHSIWVPVVATYGRNSYPPAPGELKLTTNYTNYKTADHDQGSSESSIVHVGMPPSWDGGLIKARFYWTTPASSGDVEWFMYAKAAGHGDHLDASWGGGVTVVSTKGATAPQLAISNETSGLTPSGTPSGGDLLTLLLGRSGSSGSDTLAADASLIGVMLSYNTIASTDA